MTNDAVARVLIVEDEALIAFELAQIVEELGHQPLGPVRDVLTALDLLEQHDCDAAILDIQLSDETSLAVADALQRKGCPWIFTTGYDAAVVDGRFDGVPVLVKPCPPALVARLVDRMIATGS